jgi:hypothetical protein
MTPDGECPVLLVSHETLSIEREWSTIAEFLREVLAEDAG